jgi:hypothetical protein
VLQARDRAPSPDRIESVGKRALDERGKHPVNEGDEGNWRRVNTGTAFAPRKCGWNSFHVIAGEAKQSMSPRHG